MEKAVATFGFTVFCFCFMLALVVCDWWLLGCAFGLAVFGFGWCFWRD